MPAEARITPIWKKQKLFIAVFLFGIAGWFFIDGKWVWPRSNQRWLEHSRLEKEKRLAEWPAIAKERGWETKPPEKYYEKDDLMMQFVLASVCAVGGAFALAYWRGQIKRTLRSDADAVYAPNGTRVPFTAITAVDAKKWENKGLAKVRYEIEGKRGKFTLDDYKFDAEPVHEIYNEIQAHLASRSAS